MPVRHTADLGSHQPPFITTGMFARNNSPMAQDLLAAVGGRAETITGAVVTELALAGDAASRELLEEVSLGRSTVRSRTEKLRPIFGPGEWTQAKANGEKE